MKQSIYVEPVVRRGGFAVHFQNGALVHVKGEVVTVRMANGVATDNLNAEQLLQLIYQMQEAP